MFSLNCSYCSNTCYGSCGNNCGNNCGTTCGSYCSNTCGSLESQNATLSETNLMDVLGVSTIEGAMAALRTRCNNGFHGLALGMYLELPEIFVSGVSVGTGRKMVIAGFNTYKGLGGYNNNNHILFVIFPYVNNNFMFHSNTAFARSNYGYGYHYTNLRQYLDNEVKSGLNDILGDYIYPVHRYMTDNIEYIDTGEYSTSHVTDIIYNWHEYSVWAPTEYEVCGKVIYSQDTDYNTAIPLYNNYSHYLYKPAPPGYKAVETHFLYMPLASKSDTLYNGRYYEITGYDTAINAPIDVIFLRITLNSDKTPYTYSVVKYNRVTSVDFKVGTPLVTPHFCIS